MLTAVIDAHEERKVACYDIPGAFLHAELDEDVIMVLKGRLAELMVQVAPNLYRKYISVDSKGKPILYVKLQKALYGLMRSALLFYRRLVKDLEGNGFVINPYDPCIANKMVNGTQMMVCWHVDDLKVSHKDDAELTKFGEWLNQTYGVKVASHRGDKHEYLGMTLDYSSVGKVKVLMVDYIKQIISEFPEVIDKNKITPAADWLYDVRDVAECTPLPEEQAVAFHRTVAQLLFLCNRSRRDIQTAVAFLTTRVKGPDQDDWGKLKRVLGYLKGTIYMPLLILSVTSLTVVRWWVDAAYAVHSDCNGQTGAGMSFGQGMPISFLWKQKINTRSSTEVELIGVDDALRHILWCRYFLQEQGYDMEPSIVYQDNMSAMLMEKNGKSSCSKRTKHIKVRYFFVKDQIERGEIQVEHRRTDQMWIDVNTKPLQGAKFREFRSKLMGIPENYVDAQYEAEYNARQKSTIPLAVATESSQECVGGNAKGGQTRESQQPLIRIVRGRRWSPGVYRALRMRGLSLEAAWRGAFV